MLKHIIGLLKADSGIVEVDGVRVDSLGKPADHRVPAQVRHGVPGRGPLFRLDDDLAERRLPPPAADQKVATARSTSGSRSAWRWCASKG